MTLWTTLKKCTYHNLPYISTSSHGSIFQKAVPHDHRHNVWIIAIGNNHPITINQVKKDFQSYQHPNKYSSPIQMVIAKRDSRATPSKLQYYWTASDQFRIVPHNILDSSNIPDPPVNISHPSTSSSPPVPPPSSVNPPSSFPHASSQETDDDSHDSNSQSEELLPSPTNLRRSKRISRPSQFLKHLSDVPLTSKYATAVDYIVHEAMVSRLVHQPHQPDCPNHIGEALQSQLRSLWIDCLFDAYDKMHKTCTLSIPFFLPQLPEGTTILRPRLTCEVKITDSEDYYELKYRMCADGSRMVEGLDYDISYAPVIYGDSLLLMIALAASKKLTFYFLDISNAFQSNVIHDPTIRHYLHLPSILSGSNLGFLIIL